MGISINIQRIKQARARRISDYFSTVDCTSDVEQDGWFASNEVSLFIEGPGHEDAAARIAALINEQVVRRDAPKHTPLPYENSATIPQDDGPDYEQEEFPPEEEYEPVDVDEEQAAQMAAWEESELLKAEQAAAEEAAYNEEDRLGKEAHARAMRRDDKPWTPHEDEIERDVVEGRRDSDGDPI